MPVRFSRCGHTCSVRLQSSWWPDKKKRPPATGAAGREKAKRNKQTFKKRPRQKFPGELRGGVQSLWCNTKRTSTLPVGMAFGSIKVLSDSHLSAPSVGCSLWWAENVTSTEVSPTGQAVTTRDHAIKKNEASDNMHFLVHCKDGTALFAPGTTVASFAIGV